MESDKENNTDRLFSESIRNIAENIVDTRMDVKSVNGKVAYIENRVDCLYNDFKSFKRYIYLEMLLLSLIMVVILIFVYH